MRPFRADAITASARWTSVAGFVPRLGRIEPGGARRADLSLHPARLGAQRVSPRRYPGADPFVDLTKDDGGVAANVSGAECSEASGALLRGATELTYLLYRLNSSTAFVPPNPKLLLITASTRTSRGWFGT